MRTIVQMTPFFAKMGTLMRTTLVGECRYRDLSLEFSYKDADILVRLVVIITGLFVVKHISFRTTFRPIVVCVYIRGARDQWLLSYLVSI